VIPRSPCEWVKRCAPALPSQPVLERIHLVLWALPLFDQVSLQGASEIDYIFCVRRIHISNCYLKYTWLRSGLGSSALALVAPHPGTDTAVPHLGCSGGANRKESRHWGKGRPLSAILIPVSSPPRSKNTGSPTMANLVDKDTVLWVSGRCDRGLLTRRPGAAGRTRSHGAVPRRGGYRSHAPGRGGLEAGGTTPSRNRIRSAGIWMAPYRPSRSIRSVCA
jgi:hypothetical protein